MKRESGYYIVVRKNRPGLKEIMYFYDVPIEEDGIDYSIWEQCGSSYSPKEEDFGFISPTQIDIDKVLQIMGVL